VKLSKGRDLVVVGVCAVDCLYYLEELPSLDTKCSSRDLIIQSGGVGGNIALAAAQMGLNCALIAKEGAKH
jgi:sugar/nucleoside kinase (ribokinase family)